MNRAEEFDVWIGVNNMVEPTKGEILAYASLGYELVRWKGQPYFVNLDLESSRLKFSQYLEKETNKKWGIFKENTGNKNWVWYREDMYQVDDGYIRLANNEAVYFQNKAIFNACSINYIEKIKITAILDNKTCKDCNDKNGSITDINTMQKGIDMPPFHVGCRCYLIPFISISI